jgi:hypothetical protein
MVVVMVQGQHRTFKVSDGYRSVNSENSMHLIEIADSRCPGAVAIESFTEQSEKSSYSFS